MLTRSQLKKMQTGNNCRIIFYDLETSGFNPYHHEITEIGATDNFGNSFNILMKNTQPLSKKVINITGITDQMLKSKGIKQKTGLQRFHKFMNQYGGSVGKTYLIAHNNNGFDYPFIKHQFQKHSLVLNPNLKFVDSLRLCQLLLPQRNYHSLRFMCEYFNVENEATHRAYGDVKALSEIFAVLCKIFKSKYKFQPTSKMELMDEIQAKLECPF